MSEPYITDAGLAQRLGKSRGWVHARCRDGWPHMRAGKSYRFTAGHVAAIEALLTVDHHAPAAPADVNPWGRSA